MFKKYGKYLVLGVLAAAIAVAGVSAYFTATDNATNSFNVHEVDVELNEPQWAPNVDTDNDGVADAIGDVTPNETIAKDPTVTNIGNTDQFVFVKVTVPYKDIVTAGLDGTKNAQAETELFTWNAGANKGAINAAKGAGTGAVNGEWVLVKTDDTKADVVEYIYAYGTNAAMTALAPEATTTALFDSITLCNAIEGQGLENTTLDVDVEVYAIQTSDLNGGVVAPAQVLEIYTNQNLV
jgi:predicted ribosomally synthesized peptide with SipW-like signal peptide